MSETPTLSPYSHNATAGSYMNLLTYSTLFATDMDLNPQPELVESYENESETRWVFHLKQGVKFHDGSEMTAQDVKASLEYAKTFAEVSQFNNMIASVEVVDDYTVAIETNGPSAVLLTNLCSHGNAIVPKTVSYTHLYGQKRRGIGEILRTLCDWKKVKIVEAEVCPDHIHMLVEIPPKYSVSSFMGYLKGKSSLMLYEKFPELKFKYRNREFWCRGYYVDTAGKNDKKIAEYIRHQLEEDQAGEQLTMGNF